MRLGGGHNMFISLRWVLRVGFRDRVGFGE